MSTLTSCLVLVWWVSLITTGLLTGSKWKVQSTSKLWHVLVEGGFPVALTPAPEKCPTVFLCCP